MDQRVMRLVHSPPFYYLPLGDQAKTAPPPHNAGFRKIRKEMVYEGLVVLEEQHSQSQKYVQHLHQILSPPSTFRNIIQYHLSSNQLPILVHRMGKSSRNATSSINQRLGKISWKQAHSCLQCTLLTEKHHATRTTIAAFYSLRRLKCRWKLDSNLVATLRMMTEDECGRSPVFQVRDL